MKEQEFFSIATAVFLVIVCVGCSQKSTNPTVRPTIDVLGIYTDTATAKTLTNGYNLYVWGGTGTINTASPEIKFPPNTLQFTVGSVGWGGIGFQAKTPDSVSGIDITAYTKMHFWIKTTATGKVTACLQSVNLIGAAPAVDISAYGYSADSAWHEINVPFSAWPMVDLTRVNVYAGFVIAATRPGDLMFIDDVWYAK